MTDPRNVAQKSQIQFFKAGDRLMHIGTADDPRKSSTKCDDCEPREYLVGSKDDYGESEYDSQGHCTEAADNNTQPRVASVEADNYCRHGTDRH